MSKRKTRGIKVVSKAKAEEAAYVVCAAWDGPTYFPNDLKGECSDCGKAVRFRPHAPKKPLRLCMECFVSHVKAH